MADYDDFPSLKNFRRVLQSCPQAALLYVSLWKLKDRKGKFSVLKNGLKKQFLLSPTLFRNLLIALSRVDILEFEETLDFFVITWTAHV